MANIFDLENLDLDKVGGKKDGKEEPKEKENPGLSEADIVEYLSGYTMVKNSEIQSLAPGTLIAYKRKDGVFKRGGKILNIITAEPPRVNIQLESGYKYYIKISEISNAWIKNIISNDEIAQRLQKVENAIQKLYALYKKLDDSNKKKL